MLPGVMQQQAKYVTKPTFTNVWHGVVADRINMYVTTDLTDTNFWNVNANAQVVFFLTSPSITVVVAPDGTTFSGAQLLAEANALNVTHTVSNSFSTQNNNAIPYRFSIFAINGGRARFTVTISDDSATLATATFDPSYNGPFGDAQIGAGSDPSATAHYWNYLRGPTSYVGGNPPQVAYPTGNWNGTGHDPSNFLTNAVWCRCTVDFTTRAGHTQINTTITLDGGSGTAAAVPSYVGQAGRGMWLWRPQILPKAAYSLISRVFFDDFNSLTNIDMLGTREPGFNFYPDQRWLSNTLRYPSGTQSDAPFISQSGSLLQLSGDVTHLSGGLSTACQGGSVGTYIGTTLQSPFYGECSIASNWPAAHPGPGGGDNPAFYAFGIHWFDGTPNPITHAIELDIVEVGAGQANCNIHDWPGNQNHSQVLTPFAGPLNPLPTTAQIYSALHISCEANGGGNGQKISFWSPNPGAAYSAGAMTGFGAPFAQTPGQGPLPNDWSWAPGDVLFRDGDFENMAFQIGSGSNTQCQFDYVAIYK